MRRALGGVPEGYVIHQVAETSLVFDAAHADELVPLRLADPATRRALFARAALRGRGRAPSVPLSPETSMVLRLYRHGGAFGGLLGSRFLRPDRALAELAVTTRAERSGAPVPHVLCVALWPTSGPFWSAMIGTREERGAKDLLATLQSLDEPRARCALARRVGLAVGRLHDAGIEHADLQLRNLLVTDRRGPSAGRIVIVDLDRARMHRESLVPTRRRASNLGRLARSVVKEGLWSGRIRRREVAAFLGGYLARRRRLRTRLRGFIPLERTKLLAHRLTWRPRGIRPAPARSSHGGSHPRRS